MGFDFIMIVPLLPPHHSFSFVFGYGVSFLVCSSVFLSMTVQQFVVIPMLLQEGMSTHPSTPPSWISPLWGFILFLHMGSSLVFQWLGLGTFTAVSPCSIPGQGTKIPQSMQFSTHQKNNSLFIFIFCYFNYSVSWCGPLWADPVWDSLCFLDLDVCFHSQVREVFIYYVSKYVLCPFLSLFSFWYPYNVNVSMLDDVSEVS